MTGIVYYANALKRAFYPLIAVSNKNKVKARIYLRQPLITDEPGFLEAVRKSRPLHRPWTTPPSTPTEFKAYLDRMCLPAHSVYFVCLCDSHKIAGVINVTDIILGCFRSGYLGYYVFAGFERQGLMREGLQAVIQHAFHSLKLHRLEANVQPENVASIALLKSCGFSKEGYSPRYLKIKGRWRDHERWAILAK